MSEEKIIEIMEDMAKYTYCTEASKCKGAIQGLLDLYKAEKEKCKRCEMYQNNNTLMEELEELRNQNAELRDELEAKNAELNKEKEKNKTIKEYVKQCDWHDNDVYIGEDILEILEEEDK